MGRKKKDSDLQEKLGKYKEDYELDDLNKSNDESSLIQLCKYELEMDRLFTALSGIDATGNPKGYKDLMSAARDNTNAYNSLMVSLGITRKDRASKSEETPKSYIDKLKSQARYYQDKRLKKIICTKCNQLVMKYHIYVTEKGENGSIECKDKEASKIKFSFKVECPNCGAVVLVDERENSS